MSQVIEMNMQILADHITEWGEDYDVTYEGYMTSGTSVQPVFRYYNTAKDKHQSYAPVIEGYRARDPYFKRKMGPIVQDIKDYIEMMGGDY